MSKSIIPYFFLLSIIWILCIIVVNPIGDFPLNDDWSYAHNTKALAIDHKIVFDDFGAMTLIVHTIWGALFTKIFGFSFTTLRASTLLLGWGTLLVSFLFFQEGGLKEKKAFGATLLLMFNFFFFANSFTYMTEVPFLFFFMSAAFFFLKTINKKSIVNLFYATIFCILATLIRQIGVLLPIAFFIVFMLKNKSPLKHLIQATSPCLITFSSLFLFTHWRAKNYGLSKNYGNVNDMLDNFLSGKFYTSLQHESYGFFVFWGLFLLPLLILLVPYFWKVFSIKKKMISLGITFFFCLPFILIPYKTFMGNSFANIGVGPHVLPSSSGLSPTSIGRNDWENLYTIGFIAAIFLVKWIFIKSYQLFYLIKNNNSNTVNWSTLFALTFAFGYFLFLMLNNHHIDRYNLIAFPFLILLIIPIQEDIYIPKTTSIISLILFLAIATFSIFSTHDYLSWNRARWEVTNFANNDLAIPYDHLNGGFEYKGLYRINNFTDANWEDLDKWNSHKEQYKIAFSQQCKYKTIKTANYQRYIPFRVDSIFLLQKEILTQFDTIFCDAERITSPKKTLLTNQKNITIKDSEQVKNKSHQGRHSVVIHPQQKGFSFQLKNITPCEKIYLSVWISPIQNLPLGVLMTDYLTPLPTDFKLTVNEGNEWGKATQEFKIPSDIDVTELNFYFQNNSNQKIWVDDLMIVRMK